MKGLHQALINLTPEITLTFSTIFGKYPSINRCHSELLQQFSVMM